MAKKRSPFDIEPAAFAGFRAMNEDETAIRMEERFGPAEVDEEDHLFGTKLLGADINPLDEQWQRPSGMNNRKTDNFGD